MSFPPDNVPLLASNSTKSSGFIDSFLFEDLFRGHLSRTPSPNTYVSIYTDMEVRKKTKRCLKRMVGITTLILGEGVNLNEIENM
jgi:hypothetical protein